MTSVTLIAAVARNGVIGNGPDIPWRLPEDFAFFKRTTMGHPLVMGRLTFDAIGRVLPGRRTIVVTHRGDWAHPGVEVAHSFEEALALAGPSDEVFVCGGGHIYAEAMPWAHRLLVTEVDQLPEGDVFFPPIDVATWQETAREQRDGFVWVTYDRRTGELEGVRFVDRMPVETGRGPAEQTLRRPVTRRSPAAPSG